MAYLFVVAIAAVAGYVAGLQMKGQDLPVYFDIGAGAAGGSLLVLLSRMMGPAASAGFLMSFIVAVIGGVLGLYAMRKFMKSREIPVPVARKRRP
jgi:uncharacterized membrane protein YeaQ/YmgE (transglycosylase-associated protein family)